MKKIKNMATFRVFSGACVLAALCPQPIFAASDSQVKENKIEITGSRLKRINIEGPSPVSIISREDIDRSGQTSISEILRNVSANSFGSRRESSGRSGGAQSHAGINLRGLGEQRTLVLINGRRMANSPGIPDTQNLNMIPLGAVERIEILKDGASSIYGSDAVGGVVNVILRRDLDANQVALHIGRPEQRGGDENYLNLWGGQLDNKDSFTYAITVSGREQTFYRDRELTAVGLSDYGYPGSYSVTIDNPNPNGADFLTQTFADGRCPSALGESEAFPNSVEENGLCRFNFAQVANHIPESALKSLYLFKDHVMDNGDSWFAQASFTRVETQGIFAPTPHIGGNTPFPTMDATNPNNPTQGTAINFDTNGDGTPDTLVNGPFDLQVYYRNIAGGPRITDLVDDSMNFSAGLEGDLKWFGGSHYKLGTQYNRNTSDEVINGLARRDLLQSAIDDGSFDIFAVNGPTDLALAESFAVDTQYESEFSLSGLDFTLTTELGELENGAVTSAWGIDFKHHEYESRFFDSFSGDLIDGRAGGGSAGGDRDIVSLFSEINLPMAEDLDVNLSLRFDDYSDAGNAVSPKIGVTWHINDNWLLRSSIGSGFRAPSLFELYSAANQSFPSVVDTRRCQSAGDSDGDGTLDEDQDVATLPPNSPCRPNQIQTVTNGNQDLEPEDSKSFSLGFVYQPSDKTRFALNYYSQEFTNQISRFPLFDLLDEEAENEGHPDVIRDQSGQIIMVNRQYNNFSGARAAGLDIEFEYGWATKSLGEFKYRLDFNATIVYEIETVPGNGFFSIDGDIGRPDHRFTTGINWEKEVWSASLDALVIPKMEQQETELGSWIPLALQVNYKTDFGSRFVFGVRNLLDDQPPSSEALGHPFYLTGLNEITGRVSYFRYIQAF